MKNKKYLILDFQFREKHEKAVKDEEKLQKSVDKAKVDGSSISTLSKLQNQLSLVKSQIQTFSLKIDETGKKSHFVLGYILLFYISFQREGIF